MEILAEHGTDEQRERWLEPLLEGRIRSCFSMTEPEVSGSDPTLLQARAVLDGDEWVIDGHKWFTSGAVGAELAIAMVVTDPDAPPLRPRLDDLRADRHPRLQPGAADPGDGPRQGPRPLRDPLRRLPRARRQPARRARAPASRSPRTASAPAASTTACGRSAPPSGRYEMMCRRANERDAFGGPLADKQFVQESIAASRMEIDQARLLTLYAAWKMDTEGKRAARQSISAIKIVAANMVMDVLDRAIQIHGSLGMTDDTPLAALWRFSRMLRLADGPDEVHKMVLARRELNRWAKRAEAEARASWSRSTRPRPV